MSSQASEALAMKLLSTVESFVDAARAPRPAVARAEFAAPLRVPPTLAALWEWCDGEQTPGLFRLAHALLSGFPHEEGALEHAVSNMELCAPQNAVRDYGWPPDWLCIGDNGTGGSLVVDGEGAVWLWSSNVDIEPIDVHASFEQWMQDLGRAIEQGRFAFTCDASHRRIVVDDTWFYDLDDYGWWPVNAADSDR